MGWDGDEMFSLFLLFLVWTLGLLVVKGFTNAAWGTRRSYVAFMYFSGSFQSIKGIFLSDGLIYFKIACSDFRHRNRPKMNILIMFV